MSATRSVIATRQVAIGIGEVVELTASRCEDGRVEVTLDAVVIHAGVESVRGPLFSVPGGSVRKLARALNALASEAGVEP